MRKDRVILGLTLATAIILMASCGTAKNNISNKKNNKHATALSQDSTSKPPRFVMPGKEARAVWVATIGGIDWPRRHFTEASQKAWYTQMLDTLQRLNVNTVFFQVRPKADAFYDSPYEPWSQYVTGYRGKAPDYDVLRWVIDETHRRGMSFHAWINPYRVDQKQRRGDKFGKLDARIPRHLVKDYRMVRVYNPAMPETRQRISSIVADLLRRYDVDGIHLDDYFYPALQKGEKMRDEAEYKRYGKGFASIADFRRAMVDSLIVATHDTIKAIRPSAVFSISPQGNYENNYNTMYADIALWSARGWCDVIIPQLYWSTERWFLPRLKWFSENATSKTKLLIGYALYRFGEKAKSNVYRTADDLARQIDAARADGKVSGAALYSAYWLMNNPVNINGVIASRFPRLTLAPYLGQGDEIKPEAPVRLTASGRELSWAAVDGCYYAVYRADGEKAELEAVAYDTHATAKSAATYFVTAVRKGCNAESLPSRLVTTAR